MIIARTIDEFKKARIMLLGSVGFVPTMGALHEGHLSLIRQGRQDNDHLIVSIFVNPTQFLADEDLDAYPKQDEADIAICKLAGVDILFMPTKNQMYEPDELLINAPAVQGYILEGAKRPGHFDGMLQIVMKLLNITSPNRAYFGKKDAQQLALVIQMVKTYYMDVEIIPCETVRDNSGLALSSRNKYMTSREKIRALAIPKSLKRASDIIISGETSVRVIKQEMLEILREVDKLEYIEVVSRKFRPIDAVKVGDTVVLVAAWLGKSRLIDNIWI